MNKFFLFLILFFFFCHSIHSQVQKIFYVDDVETIDLVTVNFCVDDNAKINEVEVIEEKTSYKNKIMIDALIKYLKSIQYHENSQLKNNCYDSTFEFVNKKYEFAELSKNDFSKCEKFKVGRFKYTDFRYENTKIKRRKTKQIEKDTDFKEKYRITWPTPCEYELEYLTVNDVKNKSRIGKAIKIKIVGFIPNGYVYKSKLLDYPEDIGIIKFVN